MECPNTNIYEGKQHIMIMSAWALGQRGLLKEYSAQRYSKDTFLVSIKWNYNTIKNDKKKLVQRYLHGTKMCRRRLNIAHESVQDLSLSRWC